MDLATFSNRTERLFEEFKCNVFCSKKPFAQRIIIVPSPMMRSWLTFQMASEGIAAGLKITYLNQAVDYLLSLLSCQDFRLPSRLEIALAIEQEIRKTLLDFSTLTTKEQEAWSKLKNYVAFGEDFSVKGELRLTALANRLASLFIQYGKHAGKLVEDWDKGLYEDWQAKLWQKVFCDRNAPYKLFSNLSNFESLKKWDVEVSIFALSYIPSLYQKFFSQLAIHIPIHHYVLAPSSGFWSDFTSDRERSRLQSFWERHGASVDQQKALDEFLYDHNPILANFGKIGREMAKEMETENILCKEQYLLPKIIENYEQYTDLLLPDIELVPTSKLSLLEALQADLLLLRNPKNSKKIELSNHKSIQIHNCHNKLREVECLYQSLLNILSQDDSLEPSDILIMAPNINDYIPFIKMVFDSSESKLRAAFLDQRQLEENPVIQSFTHLIKLAFGRWEIGTVLKLLDFPSFRRKLGLKKEDANWIRDWAQNFDVRWALNKEQRAVFLKKAHAMDSKQPEEGTWDFAFARTLKLLISSNNSEFLKIGQFQVENTQSLILGKWIETLHSLEKDLKWFQDDKKLSLEDWVCYLHCLYESYFETTPEDTVSYEAFCEELENFRKVSRQLDQALYPFSTIKYHLLKRFEEPSEQYAEYDLNSVRCCSLLPMRAIPSKVIALLGMDEDSFPRQNSYDSLNRMLAHRELDYCPTQIDYDRFLFLETIISARQFLLLFYKGFSSEDGVKQQPSILLTEVLNYLDQAFLIDGKSPSSLCQYNQPYWSFDKAYFSNESQLINLSGTDFSAACAFYQAERQPPPQPNQFNIISKLSESDVIQISLKELNNFARNPLKAYFNKTHGIYLETPEDRQIQEQEDFHLSHLQRFILNKEVLRYPPDQIVKEAKNRGLLPTGPFKPIILEKLIQEMKEIRQRFDENGIQEIFTIRADQAYEVPLQSETHWKLPPLKIACQGKLLQITGTVSDLCQQGLITQLRGEKSDLVKLWPQALVLSCLSKEHNLTISQQFVFLKNTKKPFKQFSIEDPHQMLAKYLDYYFKALQKPSPLIPEWSSSLLANDFHHGLKKIKADLNSPFKTIHNDYLKLLLKQDNLETLIKDWEEYAKELFKDMI